MARTFRNRNSVPEGWTVRDDGIPYLNGDNAWGGHDWHLRPRYRRHHYRCERKEYRKEHYRQFRAQVKTRMAHEDYENLPRYRRTSGWLTW